MRKYQARASVIWGSEKKKNKYLLLFTEILVVFFSYKYNYKYNLAKAEWYKFDSHHLKEM